MGVDGGRGVWAGPSVRAGEGSGCSECACASAVPTHPPTRGEQEGQDYLTAMACAANYAWVNRSSMTFLCRQAFAKMFDATPDDLDMHVVYDVSHNIAKVLLRRRRRRRRRRRAPPCCVVLCGGGGFLCVLATPNPHHQCCPSPPAPPPPPAMPHTAGRGAHGGRSAQDAAGAPQGLHPRLPAAPPAHPRRLPAHGAAGAHRRHHGHLQLRPHGCAACAVMPCVEWV